MEALPLLEQWSRLPQFKAAELLAAGRAAQALLTTSQAPCPPTDPSSLALTEGLIEALAQADRTMASAADWQSLNLAISSLLEPAFGPNAVSLLAPGETDPDLQCLRRWQSPPAKSDDTSLNNAPSDEQLTCMPLHGHDQLLGSLLCCGPSPSPSDMLLLNMLAERIADRLQKLTGDQPAVPPPARPPQDFSQLLALTKPQELCRHLLKEAVALVPAGKASLMLLNGSGSKLHLAASIGMNQAMASDLSVPADQGIAGQVLKSGQPLRVEDLEQDSRITTPPRPRFASKSLLCLPLTAGDQHHGVICLTDRQDGQPFSETDLNLISPLAATSALLIERLRNRRQVSKLVDQIAFDPATGVYSASMFKRRFSEEASRAGRLKKPLALLLFTVDQPDQVNQRKTLELAGRLQNLIRKMDVVGRLDSELLAVLLPDTTREVALSIAERLHGLNDEEAAETALAISCGIALYPGNGASFEALLKAAKVALQTAWQQGGNRAVACQTSARNDKIVFL
ncbi:MAG: sensor domain-containing diguanylate cyclase [Syntrophotaleaceae bacterium]